MQPIPCLYKVTRTDNVATALADLHSGGAPVSVVRSDGQADEPLALVTHVRRFHKVALTELQPGDPIVKWGQQIGIACQHWPRGATVHLSSFVPSAELLAHWGDVLPVLNRCCEEWWSKTPGWLAPGELGTAVRDILGSEAVFTSMNPSQVGKKATNRTSAALCLECLAVSEPMRQALFGGLPPSFLLGTPLASIGRSQPVHLGCIAPCPHLCEPERKHVEQLASAYRFVEGRLFDFSPRGRKRKRAVDENQASAPEDV